MLHEDQLSECCEAPYTSVGGAPDFDGDKEEEAVTMHAECSVCKKPCNLKPVDIEIKVEDTIHLRDVPHG